MASIVGANTLEEHASEAEVKRSRVSPVSFGAEAFMHASEGGEADTEMSSINLEIKMASGRSLATLSVGWKWTGSNVKCALAEFMPKGAEIGGLAWGSKLFEDAQTVQDLGITNDEVVQIILNSKPALHLFKPCSSEELSMKHLGWHLGGGGSDDEGEDEDGSETLGLCLRGVQHQSMDSAPELARAVALEIKAAFGRAQIGLCGPYYTRDEIIVISGQTANKKEAILEALAIAKTLQHPFVRRRRVDVWEQATVTAADWSVDVIGRSFSRQDHLARRCRMAIAISDVMAKRLTNHFHFQMFEMKCDHNVAPHVFGGMAADGSIVGMLAAHSGE